jgi:uracil-DNA glycosylase
VTRDFETTVAAARACEICRPNLPLGPRPVFQIGPTARILIVGQAPGRRVHETGIAFNDPSGERLRKWMGIDRTVFYDSARITLLPMGFCYPGRAKSGDLPPRPECAAHWRQPLLNFLPNVALTLVIGQYAHAWHLGKRQKGSLTDTVKNWKEYWPDILALPHPSPRNNIWLRRNPWFEDDILPVLRDRVAKLLAKQAGHHAEA